MKRILLVVDDWEALDRYESRLNSEFEVVTAPFGQTGLEELERTPRPDAVVVELGFENMTNEEFLARLGAEHGDVPVLELSHPFDERSLVETVNELLRTRRRSRL